MERQSQVDGLQRRPISRLEYERMAEVGILAPGERIELLRGEIVAMSPIGSRHAWSVAKINRSLVEQLGPSYDIRPQSPLTLWDDSEPEPDLAVVPAGTPDRHPDTCLLVIEVAQTSLRVDATVKAALYAEAGIPVYWIVDVARGLVLVHTEPVAGAYQRTDERRPGDVLTAPHLPTLAIPVAAIVAT
jgi:Uma2 family endonuclease